MNLKKQKRLMYFFMICLITIWGLDYVVAKQALENLEPLVLLYLKYFVGFVMMLLIKQFLDRGWKLQKKDILTLIACTIFGEILYFYCEYTAMDYLPVSIITIILAFVPAISIITEIVFYKKSPSKKLMAGVFFCVIGVALVIGVDYEVLFEGKIIGYLLTFGAILSWNTYNFLTASMHQKYSSISLTVMQLACVLLILSPYMIMNIPEVSSFTPAIMGGIVYLGVFGAGLGFLIQVKALHVIGPTTTALFSNFMPITTTIFGWIFLNETILPLQIMGGIVVITSGYFVIKEKGKMEEGYDEGQIQFDYAD